MGFAVFAVFAAMFGLFPSLTPYLARLGADARLAGAVVAVYSLANLVGNAVGGWAGDRRGRRLPLVAGLAAGAVSMLGYAVPRLEAVALAHGAHGLAAGVAVPAIFAWVGDRSLVTGRGRAMGRTGAAIGAAAVVAPVLGGLGARVLGEVPVFLALGALLGGAAAVAERLTRDAAGRSGAAAAGACGVATGARSAPSPPGPAATSRGLALAYGAGFTLQLGFGLIVWLLPLQAQAAALGPGASGMVLGLIGLVASAWMAASGRLADRIGRRGPLAAGLGLLALGLLGLYRLPAGPAGWVAAAVGAGVLFGTGFGLLFPAASALVVDAAPPGRRTSAFAAFYVAFSLGTLAAPALGGLVLSLAGAGGGPAAVPAAPYLPGAAAAVLAAIAVALEGPGGAWNWRAGRAARV